MGFSRGKNFTSISYTPKVVELTYGGSFLKLFLSIRGWNNFIIWKKLEFTYEIKIADFVSPRKMYEFDLCSKTKESISTPLQYIHNMTNVDFLANIVVPISERRTDIFVV